jgi:plastocyanin
VAFADTKAHRIDLAVNSGSSWRVRPVEDSTLGANPSLAVDPAGKVLAVAWFDTENQNLDVARTSTERLVLAFSPPPVSLGPAATSSASGPACTPSGTTVDVVAPTGAAGSGFEKKCYAAPANEAFTVDFSNNDSGVPHNFEIFTDSSATKRLGGAKDPTEIVTGPAKATYKVDALKPGTYYFHCDVHPTTMNGQFVVAGK